MKWRRAACACAYWAGTLVMVSRHTCINTAAAVLLLHYNCAVGTREVSCALCHYAMFFFYVKIK